MPARSLSRTDHALTVCETTGWPPPPPPSEECCCCCTVWWWRHSGWRGLNETLFRTNQLDGRGRPSGWGLTLMSHPSIHPYIHALKPIWSILYKARLQCLFGSTLSINLLIYLLCNLTAVFIEWMILLGTANTCGRSQTVLIYKLLQVQLHKTLLYFWIWCVVIHVRKSFQK